MQAESGGEGRGCRRSRFACPSRGRSQSYPSEAPQPRTSDRVERDRGARVAARPARRGRARYAGVSAAAAGGSWRVIVFAAGRRRRRWRSLRRERLEMLISDIGLPEMDGYDLMRQIRARTARAATPFPPSRSPPTRARRIASGRWELASRPTSPSRRSRRRSSRSSHPWHRRSRNRGRDGSASAGRRFQPDFDRVGPIDQITGRSAAQEAQDEEHQSHDEQHVNKGADGVRAHHAEQPCNQQNDRQRHQHHFTSEGSALDLVRPRWPPAFCMCKTAAVLPLTLSNSQLDRQH